MAKIELCRNEVEVIRKGWSGSREYGKLFYVSVKLLNCVVGIPECIDFWSPDSHNWRCDSQN